MQLLVTIQAQLLACCSVTCDLARVLACNPMGWWWPPMSTSEGELTSEAPCPWKPSIRLTPMQTGMLSTRRCATTAFTDARPAHGGPGRRARCSATRCSAQQPGHCPQVVLLPLSLHRCCCACGILSRSRTVTSTDVMSAHACSKQGSKLMQSCIGRKTSGWRRCGSALSAWPQLQLCRPRWASRHRRCLQSCTS